MFVHEPSQPQKNWRRLSQRPEEGNGSGCVIKPSSWPSRAFRNRDHPGLGCSRRTGQAWARIGQPGAWRPSRSSPAPDAAPPGRGGGAGFRDHLEAGPTPEDGVCTFRCQDCTTSWRRIRRELLRQAIYDLLHRLDYSSLMPRPQHEQANPEVQEFFEEMVRSSRSTPSPAAPSEEGIVDTYFQDEARFGQEGDDHTGLGAAGFRPRAVRQTGFSSLYVLAAVCRATGAMSAVIMPTLNTEGVNLFGAVPRELPAGVHAVLIWDGAGFHTGEDVVVPSNVSLIRLPPYSPELNPVENLWHYLVRIAGRTAGTGITTRCRRRGQESVCGPRRHRNDQDRLQSSIYLKGA